MTPEPMSLSEERMVRKPDKPKVVVPDEISITQSAIGLSVIDGGALFVTMDKRE